MFDYAFSHTYFCFVSRQMARLPVGYWPLRWEWNAICDYAWQCATRWWRMTHTGNYLTAR